MNRLTRMCLITLLAGVLTAATVQVSAAGDWQRGLGQTSQEQQIERSGAITPGVLRPMLPNAVSGEVSGDFGQYFDYGRFFSYFYWNYKYYFGGPS